MGLRSWQGHKEECEVLLMAKTNLLRKEQKEHLKGEVGQAKTGSGPEVQGLSRQGFYIFI